MTERRHTRRRALVALASVVIAGAVLNGPADAQASGSGSITEYPPMPTPLAGVCEVELDMNGYAFIEEYAAAKIGRLNLATGQITEIALAPGSVPGGMDTGPDGWIWFPEEVGNRISRLNPATLQIESYLIPWGNLLQLGGLLHVGTALADDMIQGADRKMYFPSGGARSLGRFDPVTKQFKRYPIPNNILGPAEAPQMILKRGPGMTLALTLPLDNKVVIFDIPTETFRQYTVPTPAAVPEGVGTGPDGAVWFTEAAAMKIGRLDVVTGEITEYSVAGAGPLTEGGIGSPGNFIGALVFGHDGMLYTVADLASTPTGGAGILRFDPVTHAFKVFPTPTPLSSPCDLNGQEPGVIYFGETTGNRVGRLEY